MKTIEAQLIDFKKDIVEFRPRPGLFTSDTFRYADGKWIPDDGEYDTAFICMNAKLVENKGYKVCLYFEPPYRKNIRWSWCDGHWSATDERHPDGNAWHYMLVPGTNVWGEWERHRHPNEVAKESGFEWMRGNGGCNGVAICLKPTDQHIQEGLARIKGSGHVIAPPAKPVCMYCSSPKQLASGLDQIACLVKRHIMNSPHRPDAEDELRVLVNRAIKEA
jgi:hypothetical protein